MTVPVELYEIQEAIIDARGQLCAAREWLDAARKRIDELIERAKPAEGVESLVYCAKPGSWTATGGGEEGEE